MTGDRRVRGLIQFLKSENKMTGLGACEISEPTGPRKLAWKFLPSENNRLISEPERSAGRNKRLKPWLIVP